MEFSNIVFSLVIILVAGKLFGEISSRLGQSPVIGELIAGVIIGSSVLGLIKQNEIIAFLSYIGAILLLFEIGLSSNINEFLKVGLWSTTVAISGVFFPFLLGYIVCSYLGMTAIHSLFVAATLTATSVGITARVFADFKKLQTKEARIILGAAVIDDVIGLSLLAVAAKIAAGNNISLLSVSTISLSAILFLVCSVSAGIFLMPIILNILKKIQNRGALIVGAFSFCLLLSFFSEKIGLAAIVGAFAAGLVLSATDSKVHLEEQIKPLSDIFVPIFFVAMGIIVDVKLFNPFIQTNQPILIMSIFLIIAAILGKVISGYVVYLKGINKLLIGVGMIPRGEVGLIFANMGLAANIIDLPIYSSLIVIVIFTTFITPIFLKRILE